LQRGIHLIEDPSTAPSIDLLTVLPLLKKEGIHHLFVEGGGTIHFSFIQHHLFDDLYAQISPILIGGKDAKTPVEGNGFATLKDATHIAFQEYFQIGSDIVVYARNLAKES
jgi:diaminohydroxyphosphoribosylaminopyrimidine deaminase/5-amino-6-(5-phosphoribosylamino)uracil reductase